MLASILMTITIPLAVFLVPIYLMEDAWGILNTNLGLILPNVAVVLPFAIFIMRANYIGIPKELEEAASLTAAACSEPGGILCFPWSRTVPSS